MTATTNTAVSAGNTPPAPRSTAGAAPTRRRGQQSTGQRMLPYLLLAPAVLGILALLGWPVLSVLLTSVRKLDLGELMRGQVVWVGFDNYVEIISDPGFWEITLRTLLFTAGCVASIVLGGLLVALLMRHVPPAVRVLLQLSLVLAWAMPNLAATTTFQWIFDPNFGILNKTLVLFGFDGFAGYSWFTSGLSTLTVIVVVVAWQGIPFTAFTMYAGLLAVPGDLYEAAGIDGANSWQSFRAVTWPALRPILTVCTFLSILWDFKLFTQVWAMRQGGPDGGSTTLSVLQYLNGISAKHFGLAAAVSVLMIVVLFVLTAQYIRLLVRSREVDL
ncbi:carbohydrate ABC transporter permease [Goodfellowiella coeruleoviolacea]|uniref:N,N'-diacetylchitobiose transport system permease protein n=1 Tax=Goodfellowiella coeruleoviolacea TaxID=334858 RepID=A0AAE3GAY4_9PSEU|nr:sugar ABC transporter permease [Goodfellowiella coeruleoviolacea]MCP2164785.1 N,N'-diacetylchitobiose transport system permease protein [Goodfellowiella coeruleoviolacea]